MTLINPEDILPDNIILKNCVVIMKYAVKDNGKFYPRLFLEEALYD